jgi:hypothetical protein
MARSNNVAMERNEIEFIQPPEALKRRNQVFHSIGDHQSLSRCEWLLVGEPTLV